MTGKTDPHPGAQYLAELRESAKKATQGEWDVWREPCADKYEAANELSEQAHLTDGFAGAVYLLNASGKCPATTGCGPTSEANASHIANASPARIAAIVEYLAAEKARADAAEALAKEESEARDHWFDLATYEVGGVPQHWKDRAEKAEAAIASLTEQLDTLLELIKTGYWTASICDCPPPRSRRDNPLKNARVIHIKGRFATEGEALNAANQSISSGWANGSTIVHQPSATASASFFLSSEAANQLGRATLDRIKQEGGENDAG